MDPKIFDFTYGEGNRNLTVAIPTQTEDVSLLTLDDVDELEALLRTLAHARAGMQPPIPEEPLYVLMHQGEFRCEVRGVRTDEYRPMLLKHAVYGWVGFFIDDETARNLSKMLVHGLPEDARPLGNA